MDKILELLLSTPLARRLLAGLTERAIVYGVGALAGAIGMTAPDFDSAVADFAVKAGPIVAALVLGWLATKRIKNTEVTIEVARGNYPGTPRAVIERQVKELTKDERKQILELAATDAKLTPARIDPPPPGTVDHDGS